MDTQFTGFQIRQGTGTENAEKNDRYEFEGIISDNNTDYHFTKMSFKTLEKFAEACFLDEKAGKTGVPILPEHDQSKQPIGRSISAYFDEDTGQVIATAYIEPGLKLSGAGYADTESYIKSMKGGTTRDLSIGAIVRAETCDICESKMKRASFFGMQIVWCEKNGHYPGQKLYRDSKGKFYKEPGKGRTEKIVTSTIEDAELKEFSSVSIGANARAQIVNRAKEVVEKGDLKKELQDIPLPIEDVLLQLSDRYPVIKSDFDKIIPGGDIMSTDNKTTDAKDEDVLDAPNLDVVDLQNKLEKAQKDLKIRADLSKEHEKTVSKHLDTIENLQAELGELEQVKTKNEELETSLKTAREEKNAYAERINNAHKT